MKAGALGSGLSLDLVLLEERCYGPEKHFRHLMEAVSDICFGVAEVDFSANKVQILHNALRPDEVGATFN